MYLLDGVSMMGWGCWRVLLGGNEVDGDMVSNYILQRAIKYIPQLYLSLKCFPYMHLVAFDDGWGWARGIDEELLVASIPENAFQTLK